MRREYQHGEAGGSSDREKYSAVVSTNCLKRVESHDVSQIPEKGERGGECYPLNFEFSVFFKREDLGATGRGHFLAPARIHEKQQYHSGPQTHETALSDLNLWAPRRLSIVGGFELRLSLTKSSLSFS